MTERVQKLIAAGGACSRRTAEEWIRAGRVTVNGHRISLGDRADPDTDVIAVDGRAVGAHARKVYLMLHKPRGFVTTLSDERGRRTAAELVRGCGTRVFPVGRLDRDSEGLLLFTNDGALAQRLLHPSHQVDKVYEVTVTGELTGAAEAALQMTHIRVRGLMTIPPADSDRETNMRYFQEVRALFVDINEKMFHNKLKCLSMGMSGDFEDAIRSGATMVRVGTAIFGARHYPT